MAEKQEIVEVVEMEDLPREDDAATSFPGSFFDDDEDEDEGDKNDVTAGWWI